MQNISLIKDFDNNFTKNIDYWRKYKRGFVIQRLETTASFNCIQMIIIYYEKLIIFKKLDFYI